MSNYSKTTDFEAKDSLPTGDSGKIIRGAEFETEFDAISTAIATKADTAGPTFTGTLTFETISDGTIGVTAFVDEDDMSSDSATLVPTQQSVKAYVDSQVTAQDLDFQADSGGALSIDLDSETLTFTGGTGIDTSGSGNAVTFAIDSTVATLTGTQTLTNKTLTAPTISGNLTTDGTIDGRDVATDGAKLDGIEAGATADQTAAEIRTLVGSASDSNVFTDADHSKLDGIEASADVTDTANVTAAGALMDSELTSIASVKALNQGVATTDTPTFAGLATSANVSFGDNDRAIFGAGSDLQIYHNGSHSFIIEGGTGDLYIGASTNIAFMNAAFSENKLLATTDGALKLYYDGGQKLATTSTGIDVTGVITTDGMTTSADINFGDNDKAVFGAGPDLQIYHDGSDSYIKDIGTGSLKLAGADVEITTVADIKYFSGSSGVSTLYHVGDAKLATTSGGVSITGNLDADGAELSGNLTLNYAYPRIKLTDSDSNSDYSIINDNGEFGIYDDTNSAFRLKIDTSGNLDVGAVTANGLDVNGAAKFNSNSAEGLQLGGDASGSTLIGNLKNTSGRLTLQSTTSRNVAIQTNGATDRILVSSGGDISFYEDTGTTAKFFWDASAEALGIGTNSPTTATDIRGANTATQGRGQLYLSNTETAAINQGSQIALGGTYSGTNDTFFASIAGRKENATSGDYAGYLQFATRVNGGGNVEHMRIDSDGNLLVGTTNANPTSSSVNDPGVELSDTGGVRSTVASNPAATFNRKTDDGNVVLFRKDGLTVGNVGVTSSELGIGGGDANLLFMPDDNSISPASTSSGGSSDGALDLGRSARRFKDLYLSGGVYLGGTGSANHLDDYEEGTFTPADGSGAGLTFTNVVGNYTKVGRSVTVTGYIEVPTTSNTSAVKISGLPFQSLNSTARSAGGIGYKQSTEADTIMIDANTTTASVYTNAGGTTKNNQLSGEVLYFGFTYFVA